MELLDHVSITVVDLTLARRFYDAVMAALSCDKVYDLVDAIAYGTRSNAKHAAHTYLSVFASQEAALDERRHWCFKARTRDAVHAFYTAALAHGGSSDGAPGLRPHYHASYYAAFVRDPSGNRLEAVCHLTAQTELVNSS